MRQLVRFVRAYRYELVAVADGMIVMMLELVGARLIAPFLGTSMYVWTAIIGVILGALAYGNWYGGRLADRGPNTRTLVKVILVAAVILLAEMTFQARIVQNIASLPLDLRVLAFAIALVVFAPPAMLMGVVAPYLAKLRLTSLEHAGQSVGRLYAAGTAGSILGTFMAGYFLIGAVGSQSLGWSLVIALVLTSFLVQRRGMLRARLGLIGMTLLFAWIVPSQLAFGGYSVLHDGDTAYARYFVLTDTAAGSSLRYLLTDNQGIQSGVDLKQPYTPVFNYTRNFIEAAVALPDPPQRIQMIGGGTFTVPTILHKQFPDAQIDIVEIDPALTRLAEQYFGYKRSASVRIVNQDGRYFLNQRAADNSAPKYDLVYMDAYSSLTPPFQLTTREAASKMSAILSPDGVLVVNLVAIPAGPSDGFALASTATYGSVFKDLKWYQSAPVRLDNRQNTIVLAANNPELLAKMDKKLAWSRLFGDPEAKPVILTDDRAPVEKLASD